MSAANERTQTMAGGRRWVVAAAVVLLAGAGYAWWPSETRTIGRRLNALAAVLSSPEHEPDLARVTRVAQLRGFLDPDLRVRAGGTELAPRDTVLAVVGRMLPPGGGITVEFADVQVTVAAGSSEARVYLTVKITSRDARTGEPTLDAREANLVMTKRNGEWVVLSAATADTLTRP